MPTVATFFDMRLTLGHISTPARSPTTPIAYSRRLYCSFTRL